MTTLCRACLTVQPPDPTRRRCDACGSPRLVSHDELEELTLAHIDCDAFFAAVEKRDDPSLADKPVIIGGGQRGVVSTCCYIARIKGVRSAMPMFTARKLCPDAVIIKPRMDRYAEVGRQLREMMQAISPLVEPLSIDEAFLDLDGTQRLHGASPAVTLARFAKSVEAELGLTVSIGLSHTKSMAKMASDQEKPRGFTVIGRAETLDFLAPLPVGALFGVGEATARKLVRHGFHTLKDLQEADKDRLIRLLGTHGLHLKEMALGVDPRPVRTDRGRKSVSSERTFNEDVSDLDVLRVHVRAACERVSSQLKKKALSGRTITVKAKTARFKTLTRAQSLERPTQGADRIFRTAEALLHPLADGTAYRLIGVGVSDLSPGEAADDRDLADQDSARRTQAEVAMDTLRQKFETDAVTVGLLLDPAGKRKPSATAKPDHSTQDAGSKAVKSESTPRNENAP